MSRYIRITPDVARWRRARALYEGGCEHVPGAPRLVERAGLTWHDLEGGQPVSTVDARRVLRRIHSAVDWLEVTELTKPPLVRARYSDVRAHLLEVARDITRALEPRDAD